MTSAALTRDDIIELLTDRGHELTGRDVRADLSLVGGAAMALAYNTRRATRDVDAVFEPKRQVYDAAARVAARLGIPAGWLNDAVIGLLPGNDQQARPILEVPGLRVSVPSARYLLALKVAAARVDRDADGIRVLAEAGGLSTAEGIIALTDEVMGGRQPSCPRPSS